MLFKILHGDPSKVSLDVTPFHAGWCYVTHDGYFYVDLNIGTEEAPNNQRLKLNAKDAETLMGKSLDEIKEYVSIQPDWNQTDETKADYIKNKPKTGGVFTTSIANNVLMLEQTGAIYATTIENNILTLV